MKKKSSKPTLLVTFTPQIKKNIIQFFIGMCIGTCKIWFVELFISKVYSKNYKSPKSDFSEMAFSIDTHLLHCGYETDTVFSCTST